MSNLLAGDAKVGDLKQEGPLLASLSSEGQA